MKHFCRIIFEEFSANLLLSLRELCHRLKLTLADQDVLNLVGGSQKMFLEICIVQQKKQVGAQSPWLIQPLPCRWNYHTWTVWSNVSWICLITLVPVCMKGSHLCFRHLLNHLKENDAQSWVFFIYCSSADERDLSQSSYPGWGFTIWTLSYLSLLNK